MKRGEATHGVPLVQLQQEIGLGVGLMGRREVNTLYQTSYLDKNERSIKDASDTCRRLAPSTYLRKFERGV